MNNLHFGIAMRHLLARRRQSLVSLMGIVLGVAFFLAISALMKGSENDFIRRLVENSPHITLQDEYRTPRPQPLAAVYPEGAVELRHVKPLPENRGIRGYQQVVADIKAMGGGAFGKEIRVGASLAGQGLMRVAGEDVGVTVTGMNPEDMSRLTTIADYLKEGTLEDMVADPDGLVIGQGLARRYGIARGDTLPITANGGTRVFRVVGIFNTGRERSDMTQVYASLARTQALLNRPNRVNTVLIKIDDPQKASTLANQIEAVVGYKAVSWQEASADIMSTLAIRNTIMYTVVSAVLLVAAFGIYNVISTVVMEKHRDIAILKAMGFEAWEIRRIFLWQGFLLGLVGAALGLCLGMVFMTGLGMITMKPPGSSEPMQMPVDWGMGQFMLATAFAMAASMLAAFLPARKGAQVHPVEVLRGGM